jgi:hypothetical protein
MVLNAGSSNRRRTSFAMPTAESTYTSVTTILDPELAPAEKLAALCHERWETVTALGDIEVYIGE